MKAEIVLFLFGFTFNLCAQNQLGIVATNGTPTNSEPPALTEAFSVTSHGPNNRIWQRAVTTTNDAGETSTAIDSFTELATGLHYWDGTQWADSSDRIQITPYGAAATNAQHQVSFGGNINTAGSIDLTMPDGRHLRSQIVGLAYYDQASSNSVMFAETQNSIGQLLQSSNQVIYTNAFTDFTADVRYTHRLNGFEQDVIMRSQPPSPAQYGLNPQTTRLQIWTEFLTPPEPILSSRQVVAPTPGQTNLGRQTLNDQRLDFGAMQIGKGKAFSIDGLTNQLAPIPVAKQWVHADGRTFLVEEVLLRSVARQIQTLPPPPSSGTNGVSGSGSGGASLRLKLPAPKLASKEKRSLQLARADFHNGNGLVLDYNLINASVTNFTFQADTTYYLSGTVNLYGTNFLEGGAVIKCANNSDGNTVVEGTIQCLTSPYRPAIFTATNDNSVGTPLATNGSSPTLAITTCLSVNQGGSVTNVRFAYAWNGLAGDGDDIEVTDCQFINCSHPISVSSDTTMLGLHNVLITMDDTINNTANFCGCYPGALTIYSGEINIYGEHVTADLGSRYLMAYFWDPGDFSMTLVSFTNSILITPHLDAQDGFGGGSLDLTASTNTTFYASSRPTGFFQTVGAANHYLPTNNPYCGYASTNSISPALVADLKTKTTHPPAFVFAGQTLNSNLTVTPQVSRDNGSYLDLGYHYDPIDYAFGDVTIGTNVTVTLTNGAVIAGFKTNSDNYGLLASPGAQFISMGANALNHVIEYNMVQESSVSSNWSRLASTNGGLILPNRTNAPASVINCRFTDFSVFAQDTAYFYNVAGSTAPLNFQDCQFHGGMIYSTNATVNLTNCLLERVNATLQANDGNAPTIHNNLFWAGNLDLLFSSTNAVVQNNLFDRTMISDHGVSNYIGTYNGYLLNSNHLTLTNSHDVFLSTSPAYQMGTLGNYYQPTNDSLIHVGSTNAGLLGLYQYTTQTNQIREGINRVTIGYHYVSTDSVGNPVDSNGNGTPDYLEDTNGSGGISITLTSPTNGASFSGPLTLAVQATISDWSSRVTNVQFYRGIILIGTVTNSPWQCSWSNVAPGLYTLTAVAHDTNGQIFTSAPVSITVLGPCSETYSSTNSFGGTNGFLANLNYTNSSGSLQLNSQTAGLPYLNLPCKNSNTVLRININTTNFVGEYLTAPRGKPGYPGHAVVDRYGNTWVANWAEAGLHDGTSNGSITEIGVVIGGTRGYKTNINTTNGTYTFVPNTNGQYLKGPFQYCTAVDRDGDGLIKTSLGQGNVLSWPSNSLAGNVIDAEDECIIKYIRTPAQLVSALALDTNNDLWVGGYCNYNSTDCYSNDTCFPHIHVKISGTTGQVLTNTEHLFSTNGFSYGGFEALVGANGMLWSSGGGNSNANISVLNYNPATGTTNITVDANNYFGMAIDPQTSNMWVTAFRGSNVYVFSPSGSNVTHYYHGDTCGGGLAIDNNGNVWVAHGPWLGSTLSVGHLRTDGTFLGNVDITSYCAGNYPDTVVIDSNGKIWAIIASSSGEADLVQIDPNQGATIGTNKLGAADFGLAVTNEGPRECYGDLTGQKLLAGTAPSGFWTVTQDSGEAGKMWGTLSWNASTTDTNQIRVEVRAADNGGELTTNNFQLVQNGVPLTNIMGEFIQIQVTLIQPTGISNGPSLHDLTVACAGTNAPIVSIISPTTNSVFGPTPTNLTIVATATSVNSSINWVEFYDGSNNFLGLALGPTTNNQYQVPWSGVVGGTYTLKAVAADAHTNVVSAPVTVTLHNPPAVRITSPTNGQIFGPAPASGTITAMASMDTGLTITSIEIFEGTTSLGTYTSGTNYSLFESGVPAGTYTLTAKATDNTGASKVSAAVTVTVDPTNSPPTVDAGSNQTINLSAQAFLLGTVTDDGLPRNSTLSIQWSKVSGPGSVSFGNSNQPVTTASFGTNGSYVLRLWASDSQYAASNQVTITVNSSLFVDAGSNQTIVLPATNSVANQFVKLTTLATGVSPYGPLSAEGLAYSAPSNNLIATFDWSSGALSNLEVISAIDGSTRQFTVLSNIDSEVNLASVRDTLGGFTVGEIFGGNSEAGEVVAIAPNGNLLGSNGVNGNAWLVISNETLPFNGSFYADRTGLFGGDLIGVSGDWNITSSGVWRIKSNGSATKLAQVGSGLAAILTVPNNYSKYGPFAGRIIVGGGTDDHPNNLIYAVDTNGVVVPYDVGLPPNYTEIEAILLIPANENFFAIDCFSNSLVGASASQFTSMAGDILVVSFTYGHSIYRVHWNGQAFESFQIGQLGEAEQAIFAPTGVTALSEPIYAQLNGAVYTNGVLWSNPPSVQWVAINGPEAVTFDSPNTTATKARFTVPGSYDLRLTATNNPTNAFSDVVIDVVRNQAPVIISGTNLLSNALSLFLTNQVKDDGWPSNQVSMTWTNISGPGGVVFTNSTFTTNSTNFTLTTGVGCTNPGTYVLQITASDGQATTTNLVTVTVASPHLTLTPAVAGPLPTNTSANLTAKLVDVTGSPLVGVSVTLQVSGGANTTNLTQSTDASGNANFSYIGSSAGEDTPYASATVSGSAVASTPTIVDWAVQINCGDSDEFDWFYSTDCVDFNRFVKYFAFSGTAGSTITAYLTQNERAVIFLRDPSNQIIDSAGGARFASDTAPLVSTLPVSGTYVFEVTDSDPTISAGFTLSYSCATPEFLVLLNGTNVPNGSSLNFGISTPSSTNGLTLVVTNIGNSNLWIGSPQLSNGFTAVLGSTNVSPGGSTTLQVSFSSTNIGMQFSGLSFSNNAAAGQYSLSLAAGAFPAGAAPSIQLTSPPNNSVFLSPANVSLSGAAQPGATNVSYVTFQASTTNGSIFLGKCTNYPYAIVWQNVGVGNYALSATAVDSIGRTTVSTPTFIAVLDPTLHQPPTAVNDTITVAPNSINNPIYVLANDTDTNPSSLTIVSFTNVHYTNAVSIINNGKALNYRPKTGIVGGDWFTYTVMNGAGLTSSATVTISIPRPIVPTIQITSPTNDQNFAAGAFVTNTATVTTGQSVSAAVQFFMDGFLFATVTNAPYNAVWTSFASNSASHTVTAVLTDSFGQQNNASVTFSVTQSNTNDHPPIASIDNVTNLVLPNSSQQNTTPIIRDGQFVMRGTATNNPSNGGDSIAYQVNLYQPDGVTLIANLTQGATNDGFRHVTVPSGGILNTNDFTMIQNGPYVLELVVRDESTFMQTNTAVSFILDSGLKIGQFSFSQQDLVIPVNGMPLAVTRTYNSINPNCGDFGYGWMYSICDLQVSLAESRQQHGNISDSDGSTFSIRTGGSRDVTLTLPNGQRTTFFYNLQSAGGEGTLFQPVWQAPPGVTATLQAQGAPVYNDVLALAGSSLAPPPFWDEYDGSVNVLDENFDFQGFILTMADGTQYRIDRQDMGTHGIGDGIDVHAFGNCYLSQIIEPSGDTDIVTTNGIFHVARNGVTNKAVLFQRQNGLITGISDPIGQATNGPLAVIYQYDSNTNLMNVLKLVDRNANGGLGTYVTNTFGYTNVNFPHYVTSIIDANGNTPARMLYDSSGRISGMIDAFGDTNIFTVNLATNSETVYDRNNKPTTYCYDTRGNVILTIDALYRVTQKVYDLSNNVTTNVDALTNHTYYAYDRNNNIIAVTNALGFTNGMTYTNNNLLATTTDARGYSSTNYYDGNNDLIGTSDALGNSTTNFYDSTTGLLLGSQDVIGTLSTNNYDSSGNIIGTATYVIVGTNYVILSTNTFGYDENGNRTNQTVWRHANGAWRGATTTYVYDGQNRLIQTIDALNDTNTTVYDGNGKQIVAIDALGRKTTYVYDVMSELIATISPDGTGEGTLRDADGRKIASTNSLGYVTQYQYDVVGRLTNTIFPDLATNSRVYDSVGRLLFSTDARGNITAYSYDALGRQLSVTNGYGTPTTIVMNYTYDPNGNRLTSVDGLNHTNTVIYDELNRMRTNLFQDGTMQVTVYDANGREISMTDQATNITLFGYDGLGHLISVTNSLQKVAKYAYDEAGNQTNQVDALGRKTVYDYDDLGRRRKRTLPFDGTNILVESTGCDSVGNEILHTNFNGVVITNQYDLMNRITNKASAGGLLAAFSYAANGQRATMTDSSGTSSYVYDFRGQLCTNVSPEGTLFYQYDLNGNLTNLSSSSGGTHVGYQYDALNRVTNVLDGNLELAITNTWYSYDAGGNLRNMQFPNGVTNLYQYDPLNRLTQLTWKTNGSPIASFVYQLAPIGNRTNMSETITNTISRNYSWIYDKAYRLTNETVTGSSPTGAIGYTYDDVGNCLFRTNIITGLGLADQSLTYNTNDWLTRDTYDNDGNTTASNGTNYLYDAENRLTNVNWPGGAICLVYNGDGQRVFKTVSNATQVTTTLYLVDIRNLTGYAQVVEELQPNGGVTNLKHAYTYGLNLISQRSVGAGESTSFFGFDGHGSMRFLTSTNGLVTDTYTYNAYGSVIDASGTTTNFYLYSGEQWDPDIALYYQRARYYSPNTARFWTSDQVDGEDENPATLNRFNYALSDPIDSVDPNGYEAEAALAVLFSVGTFVAAPSATTSQPLNIIKRGTIWFKVGFDNGAVSADERTVNRFTTQMAQLDDILTKSCRANNMVWLGDIKKSVDYKRKRAPSAMKYTDDTKVPYKKIKGHQGGVPVMLTTWPIDCGGTTDDFAATDAGQGIVYNIDLDDPNTLAHEMGHYVNWSGGNIDNNEHTTDTTSIMFAAKKHGDSYAKAINGDKEFCNKITALAK